MGEHAPRTLPVFTGDGQPLDMTRQQRMALGGLLSDPATRGLLGSLGLDAVQEGDALRFRPRLPSEEHNAALSLATNLAVAEALYEAGTGLFRVMPEVDEHDEVQRAVLGVSVVAGDEAFAAGLLQEVVELIDHVTEARSLSEERELLHFDDLVGGPPAHWEPEEKNPPLKPPRGGKSPRRGLRSSHRRSR